MINRRNVPIWGISLVIWLLSRIAAQDVRVDQEALEFDVRSIIDLQTPEDIEFKRQAVIAFLWGGEGYPYHRMPDEIAGGISDSDFVSLDNLDRIDRLTIGMDFGLKSIAYHFIPRDQNGDLAVYHQGHGGKFSRGIGTIQAFLDRGYNVIALSMPLLGVNNQPVVEFERFGRLLLHRHIQMQFLQPENGHPVRYFIEPVAVTVNYALLRKFKRIIMVGISGGGWTTTLAAAVDPRIRISFPVAGSYPHYLRSHDVGHSGTIGDYEQNVPELYRRANYLELYIMGASGRDRKQVQILNEFDSCCFGGRGYLGYRDIVREITGKLGPGEFDVYLDSSHREHMISPEALEVMFRELGLD